MPALLQQGTLARGRRIPGCFVRLSGILNDSRFFGQYPDAAQSRRSHGLESVEAIAAVEGINMIAYRHSNLSARLGVHLQLEHPTSKAAVRRIAVACGALGKLARGSA
jgi:hypothetical protein